MENHCVNLSKFCRLCRSRVEGNPKQKKKVYNPKMVTVYKETIKKLFDYDIDIDQDDICPKSVCNSCRRKLDRINSDSRDVLIESMAIFSSHNEDCQLCKDNIEKHQFSVIFLEKKKPLTLAEVINPTTLLLLPKVSLNISQEITVRCSVE